MPRFAPVAVRAALVRAFAGAALGGLAVARAEEASGLADRPVIAALAVAVMAVVAVGVPAVQHRLAIPGAVPALVGVAQFAIYCCVPETDQIPQVVSAVVVLLAVEVAAERALPWWMVMPVLATVWWSGLFGATGRESALVGTLFAAWPLVLTSISVVLPGRRADTWLLAAAGSLAAVAVARTGALQPTVGPAYLAAAIAGVSSALVLVVPAARER